MGPCTDMVHAWALKQIPCLCFKAYACTITVLGPSKDAMVLFGLGSETTSKPQRKQKKRAPKGRAWAPWQEMRAPAPAPGPRPAPARQICRELQGPAAAEQGPLQSLEPLLLAPWQLMN